MLNNIGGMRSGFSSKINEASEILRTEWQGQNISERNKEKFEFLEWKNKLTLNLMEEREQWFGQ